MKPKQKRVVLGPIHSSTAMLLSNPSCSGWIAAQTGAGRHQHSFTLRAGRRLVVRAVAESKEYYDYKDMPPMPLTVARISIPELGHIVSHAQDAQ